MFKGLRGSWKVERPRGGQRSDWGQENRRRRGRLCDTRSTVGVDRCDVRYKPPESAVADRTAGVSKASGYKMIRVINFGECEVQVRGVAVGGGGGGQSEVEGEVAEEEKGKREEEEERRKGVNEEEWGKGGGEEKEEYEEDRS